MCSTVELTKVRRYRKVDQMASNLQYPQDYDYRLGLVAGFWLAHQDLTLEGESIEIEANEHYERAIRFIVIERAEFVIGFIDGYTGYIAGII